MNDISHNETGSSAPKTGLKKGQVLDSGFAILDVVDLEELNAAGIWAKHEKTGAEVFHVLNDDIENLFTFAFATFPQDNTGAPHILEHSVLCGSQRYPLKDAFITLAQGSLQTFLNAITFPDKTVYPASSINEHDYFNLMSVYGDAVFRPLLPEWTFMQEGHRYEFTGGDKRLSITGVVYNEMKGAYSSLDTFAGLWSVKAVMPGTPYAFESGGDPEFIPGLTWEGLKEFHLSRYSPANCRVFLAGNIPTEKQLSFLNDQFFSGIEGGKACAPVNKTQRWQEPKKFIIPCPAGNESKSTIFLSWLCGDVTDTDENIALAALTEILLGHDGSPLTRALIESGLGEDITPVSGLEAEIRETLFVAGLKGVAGDTGQMSRAVEDLIMNELRRLAEEGIAAEEIQAALLAMEFSQREIKRSVGPFSLVWMRRSLRSWLHGCKPWESLLYNPAIAKIKENHAADSGYFEKIIKKYFIDNPHRALVVLEPKDDYLPLQEERLSRTLALREKELTDNERRLIVEKSEALEKIQSEADSEQALAAIPHLSRNDLKPEDDHIHRRYEVLRSEGVVRCSEGVVLGSACGIPALYHDLFTNGITYTDIAFPVDTLSGDDYIWLPFFSRASVSVGLPGMDYGEVSSLLARTVGGFIASLHTGSAVKNAAYPAGAAHPAGAAQNLHSAFGSLDLTGRDWLVYRMKCLDEKIAPSLDLALRLLSEADFSDKRRINDLVLEMKNELDSSLAPAGHIYASGRAGRFNSRSKKIEEQWSGLSQINFVHRLAELETDEVIKKLVYLREKIAGSGLIANITGRAPETAGAEFAQRFGGFGSPAPRVSSGESSLCAGSGACSDRRAEVYASASLQIGFAALALNAAPFDTMEQTAEQVLSHQLSTGALWEDIRMKGGAYGAYVNADHLEDCVCFATYRDPNPLRSLDVISAILKNGSGKDQYSLGDEDNLVKSIIGCYAKETRPRTSAENGLIDFFRFLYGMEDSYRKRKMERLVSVSTSDLSSAFKALGSRQVHGTVVIAGMKNAEEAAKSLGAEVQILPV
ncbi:MAG: insulinase family protein [Treponema sp.]|jgi:Zn-dependent M16 (insulinase) family peptidase|nr:insulinase family protein [Treponema sp.]